MALATTIGAPWGISDAAAGEAGATTNRYAACMKLARKFPEKAYRKAEAWRDGGGGDGARHCVAVSLLNLGLYVEAARRLEEMAENARSKGGPLYADLLGQAANAWFVAGKPETAYSVQTTALKLRPDDVEILIDRSISLASVAKFWEAIDDLNEALSLDPKRTDALVYRANAYRRLDSLELAGQDIDRALKMDPTGPDGLLERGFIRWRRGDTKGARDDWKLIIQIAPLSPPAEAARHNLERLDLNTE